VRFRGGELPPLGSEMLVADAVRIVLD